VGVVAKLELSPSTLPATSSVSSVLKNPLLFYQVITQVVDMVTVAIW